MANFAGEVRDLSIRYGTHLIIQFSPTTLPAWPSRPYEPGWYAQALVMLGDLYEAKGDRAKAAEYYRRHIAVFKDPDPSIARQVDAVRAKLTRVTGER